MGSRRTECILRSFDPQSHVFPYITRSITLNILNTFKEVQKDPVLILNIPPAGYMTYECQHDPYKLLNTWPNFHCSNCVSACPAAQLMAKPGAFLLHWLMPLLIGPLPGIERCYSSPTVRRHRPSQALAYFNKDCLWLLMANGDKSKKKGQDTETNVSVNISLKEKCPVWTVQNR